MKIKKSFFKSKIARRIFFLFVSCAILPMVTLAYISFRTISYELNQQARKELHQICKGAGFDIFNNLLILDSKIDIIGFNAEPEGKSSSYYRLRYPHDLFKSATLLSDNEDISPTIGDRAGLPKLTESELDHINAGKSLILTQNSRVFMLKKTKIGKILTEIRKDYLWSEDITTQLYILDSNNEILTKNIPPFSINKGMHDPSYHFEYSDDGERYIASNWNMFLRSTFFAPDWTLIIGRSKSDILKPIQQFKYTFTLLLLLSFMIVLLLSIVQIRKSLVPIELLKQGAQKVARGDFKSHISINSGDEFEELGESFNKMSKELEEMQAVLIQTEKMKTVGQMSSAIVHEINQPLTAIKGYLDLMLNVNDLSGKADRYLQMISKVVDRLSQIAGKFNRFARSSDDEPFSKVSLNGALNVLHEILEHQLVSKNVAFSLELEKELPPIMGNENSLQQVFMNLVVNAMDAIEDENADKPSLKKPMITVSTHLNNGHVIAKVEDNGPGIPTEIREKIFDPFFTTKEAGKGTGLGLAVIKSILQKHKGKIEIESKDGVGTCFILSFPTATE
ncbi:MAG: ATP-binding protein [Candidatus Heimdallarchaeota archaeon]